MTQADHLAVPVPVAGHGHSLCLGVPVGSAVREALGAAHDAAVARNWRAFHVGVPQGFASYVYRYREGAGELLYVGMTSAAQRRAKAHWQTSDWWSWVMSAEYERCHSRDEAFQLETQARRDEHPLFTRIRGYAEMIAELDRETMANHVTGSCYCARLTGMSFDGETVVESRQPDPSGWM